MCSSDSNPKRVAPKFAQINGRPVLQPKSNQIHSPEKRNNSLKKITSPKSPTLKPSPIPIPPNSTTPICSHNNNNNVTKTKSAKIVSPPISPKLKSPRPLAIKRTNNNNQLSRDSELNSSTEKVNMPHSKSSVTMGSSTSVKKLRREEVGNNMQEQRKLRIAHYGRIKTKKCTNSFKHETKIMKDFRVDFSVTNASGSTTNLEEKRCSFIRANSDPVYVAYHDEEWGVPVRDDKMLFELLVLTAAQVGSDWTSVLKKRLAFREAYAGFDAEVVGKYTEKKITSISAEYGLDLTQVRGVVDNAIRILEVKKQFGSFDKYLWGFVNHKPINCQYRSSNKIPVKTSKSESISKDMVKRGFRFVGPIVIHSFMEAAGLTNNHSIACSRHHHCSAMANHHQHDSAACGSIDQVTELII